RSGSEFTNYMRINYGESLRIRNLGPFYSHVVYCSDINLVQKVVEKATMDDSLLLTTGYNVFHYKYIKITGVANEPYLVKAAPETNTHRVYGLMTTYEKLEQSDYVVPFTRRFKNRVYNGAFKNSPKKPEYMPSSPLINDPPTGDERNEQLKVPHDS